MDNQFNYADIRNIEIVQAFENMNHNRESIITNDSVIGLWHISLIMPSGFSLVFQFYEDGTFNVQYSQMAWVPIIDSFSGFFEIEGNTILLKIQKIIKFNHSNEVLDAAFLGLQWKESEMTEAESHEELRFLISKLLTVQEIFDDEDKYPESMKDREAIILGGVNFYKYSSDPDHYR